MSNRNIRNLPLLEAFDAIMSRGSISDAAEAMNVTQSAVSKQLAQLRHWFGDELFVRTNEGMQPTPFATGMQDQVRSILDQTNALLDQDQALPQGFTGKFVLSATDEMLSRLVPKLVEKLSVQAPQLRLITLPLARDYLVRQLEVGQVNLVVAMNWNAPELLKQKRLGSDRFVCLMHEDHRLAASKLTLKRYTDSSHILVAPLGNERGVVDIELERLGKSRHVCSSVPAFNLVNEELLGHERIVTLPSRVADSLARRGPFVVKPVPIALPVSNYYALWHSRYSAEPRLRWMLEAIVAAYESN